MTIKINNKQTETEAGNILQLAQQLALPEKGVAIAVANKMVPRTEWESTVLSEGMDIIIIKAACGG